MDDAPLKFASSWDCISPSLSRSSTPALTTTHPATPTTHHSAPWSPLPSVGFYFPKDPSWPSKQPPDHDETAVVFGPLSLSKHSRPNFKHRQCITPAPPATPPGIADHRQLPDLVLLFQELNCSPHETRFFADVAEAEALNFANGVSETDCPVAGLKHLTYSFIAPRRLLITKCMPTPVHDAFQSFFETGIVDMYCSRNLSKSDRCLNVTSGNDKRGFTGEYKGSLKRADILVTPRTIPKDEVDDEDEFEEDYEEDEVDDEDEDEFEEDEEEDEEEELRNAARNWFPTIAVEIGFSQSHESLIQDARLWLEGSGGKVRVVILVKFTENPKFCLTMPAEHVLTAPRSKPYGPIYENGQIIVGALTCVFEIWRLDITTGISAPTSRISVLPRDPDQKNLTLSMLDLFGPDHLPASCVDPMEPVHFPLRDYRSLIKDAIQELAEHRRENFQQRGRKREGTDDKDQEWKMDHGEDGDGARQQRAERRNKAFKAAGGNRRVN